MEQFFPYLWALTAVLPYDPVILESEKPGLEMELPNQPSLPFEKGNLISFVSLISLYFPALRSASPGQLRATALPLLVAALSVLQTLCCFGFFSPILQYFLSLHFFRSLSLSSPHFCLLPGPDLL